MKQYKFLPLAPLFLVLFATSSYAIDITSYTVLKENLPTEKGESAKWENYIQFSGTNTKIKLARTLKRDTGEYVMGHTDQGFDEKSLKVKWLHINHLIWITWSTYSRTDAGYEYDGHIVLTIQNGRLVELFRHNYDSYWYRGGCTNYRQKLSISYFDTTQVLELHMNRHDEECGIKSDQTKYFTKGDVIYNWQYRLDNSFPRFLKGQKIVDHRGQKHKSNIEELQTDSYDGLYGIYRRLE